MRPPAGGAALLQPEIDAKPGALPTKSPNVEGKIAMHSGTAVIELANGSEAENNFLVSIQSANAASAWLVGFCRLQTLGSAQGIRDHDENGKRKVYVPGRASARLVIETSVPGDPERRSGVYDMVAVVEDTVQGRVSELPFKIAVRPLTDWALTVEPGRPLRLFRRRRLAWATVENKGNDWLYVDLKLPKEKGQLAFECDAERLAVAPSTSRRVPIHVRSKYRTLRGTPVRTPFPLSAARVDAPSVPRFPAAPTQPVPSLNLSGPVLLVDAANETKGSNGVENVYYPPIPATFTDFVSRLQNNVKSLLGLFLLLVSAMYIGTFMWETMFHKFDNNLTKVSPDTIESGGTVVIKGPNLDHTDVEVKVGNRVVPVKASPESGDIKVTFPKMEVEGGTDAEVSVHRRGLGFLTWPPIFPTLPMHVTIGRAATVVKPLVLQVPPSVKLGSTLVVESGGDVGFGDKPGTIKLGVVRLTAKWKNGRIEATVPEDGDLASPEARVWVRLADGSAQGEATLAVVDPKASLPGVVEPPIDPNAAMPPVAGGDPGVAPALGGAGAAGGGGTAAENGEESGGKTAYTPTAAEEQFQQAIEAGDKDALQAAARASEEAGEPHWRALGMYAAAVRGLTESYQTLRDELKKSPPPAADAVGQALLTMAQAECLRADGEAAKAKQRYLTLSIFLKDRKLDLPLAKAALGRQKTGW